MIISLIVAMDKNRGIGKNNEMPWHISSDLRRFRDLTMGHYIVMGRKTYESISKQLPGREMIILTNSSDYEVEGSIVLHSLEDAVRFADEKGEVELFVIGGGDLFNQAIKFADRIYLTTVEAIVDADVFFPGLEEEDWIMLRSEYISNEENDQFPYKFQILERTLKHSNPD